MIFRQRCVKDGPEEINITQEINPVEFLERPHQSWIIFDNFSDIMTGLPDTTLFCQNKNGANCQLFFTKLGCLFWSALNVFLFEIKKAKQMPI